MNNKLIFQIKPLFFFIFLSAFITFNWFKGGFLLGGAEIGIFAYNPSRVMEIQKFIWWGDVAPGMLVPHFIIGFPLYFIFSLLQPIYSALTLQIITSFTLLFLMGYGMYRFSLLALGKDRHLYAIIAGLFYMFNSYTMVEIWHRFLYTSFFLAAFLPILALFWKLWILKGRFIFLTIFLVINLLSSYMFGNLTSAITIWLLLFLITVAQVIFPWNGKANLTKVGYKFIAGLFLWILTNIWWLIPVFSVSAGLLGEQHGFEDNLSTLVNISRQTILPYTLQFANPYYLFYKQELGQIYNNFIFLIIPWIPAVVIFLGLLISLKQKYLANFGLFYIFSIVISKGAAAPFGYFYIWAFMNIYGVGLLRNPFEKLGLLLPFFGSILFVIGLETIYFWARKKIAFASKFILATIFIAILIYAFPMFNGKVFENVDYPIFVKVPPSYGEADNWFKVQEELEGIILHLPFPAKDVVTYNWEKGYHGVEINEILFTHLPSITRNVGVKRIDETLKGFSYVFNQPFSQNSKIALKLLQNMNVKYIVLHKDTMWTDTPTYGKDARLNNPLEIETALNNFEFLQKVNVFGDLVIYRVLDTFYEPKISFSNTSQIVYPGEDIIKNLQITRNPDGVINLNTGFDDSIKDNISQILIFPQKFLYNWEPSNEVLESITSQFMVDPNNTLPFNQLISIKQYFNSTGELLSETLADKLISSSSRLIELNRIRLFKDNGFVQPILDKYMSLTDSFFDDFKNSGMKIKFSSNIAKIFRLHLYIIERFRSEMDTNEKSSASIVYDKLKNYLIVNDIFPTHSLDIKEWTGGSRIHSFYIPVSSSYELLMMGTNSLYLYPEASSAMSLKVDGENIQSKLTNEGEILKLGNIELTEGMHEIGYNAVTSSNLISSFEKFIRKGDVSFIDVDTVKLTASGNSATSVETVIPNTTGGERYEITLEMLAENTKEFYLNFMEDTEIGISFNNCTNTSCYTLRPQSQKKWQSYSLITNPLNLATREVYFSIILPLKNDAFTNPSQVQIRNFNINRIMDNDLFLRKKLLDEPLSTPTAQLIEIKKISPVKYIGRIKLDKPVFLFFKESFHPGWNLQLTKDGKADKIYKHYLGNFFGNAYYIDRLGEYDFKLEFEPQKLVNKGISISVLSWMGIFLVLFSLMFKGKLWKK